jgi:ABC-type phosphate transport system substrate-binding protein
MKTPLLRPALLLAAVTLLPFASLALDAVVVANESVPVTSLDAGALKDIYAGKTMYWDGGAAVVIVVAGDQANAALEAASGMNPSAFKTHWQRLGFSGRGQPPKKADDVDKALALVASTKGAIAVVPAGTEAKGVKKLEVK